jgi:hypothetical protein
MSSSSLDPNLPEISETGVHLEQHMGVTDLAFVIPTPHKYIIYNENTTSHLDILDFYYFLIVQRAHVHEFRKHKGNVGC